VRAIGGGGFRHLVLDRPPELVAFGHVVRRRRRDLELSQEALAHQSGVNAKHIGEIERANKDPRLTTILKLLSPLGLEDDELFAMIREHWPPR
jgi:predicted transcriptional regulator